MGVCASIPRTDAAAAVQPAAAGVADGGSPASPPEPAAPAAATERPAPRGDASAAASDAAEVLEELHELQKQLSEVSSNALLGLIQSAEVLVANGGLAADTAAIYGAAPDEPGCLVLLTAYGAGAAALERAPVLRGADAAQAVSAPDLAGPGSRKLLPPHLRCLAPGARSVAAVPLGPPTRPVGCLVLASCEPFAFKGCRWQIQQQAAAAGLLRLLRQPQVAAMCRLLSEMGAASDPLEAITALLQAAPRYMASCTHLQMATRLAVLSGPGRGGAPADEATVFELPRRCLSPPPSGRAAPPSPRGSGPPALAATGLALQNTLLASAVRHRQARFVVDCGRYLQCCLAPARDVFTRASDLVASIVVLPLLPPHGGDAGGGAGSGGDGEDAWGAPLGGLYFALPEPCDFQAPRDALLGFVHSVTPVLYWKLAGREGELDEALARAAELRSASLHGASGRLSQASASLPHSGRTIASGSTPGGGGGGSTDGAAGSPGGSTDCAAAGGGSVSGGTCSSPPPAPSSARLSSGGSRHLNTEAMLQVFQAEVHKGWRRSAQAAVIPGLSVAPERLGGDGDGFDSCGSGCGGGGGGASSVHRAFWNKSAAAVKIIRGRGTEQEALSDATQMAVMSSVTHPNLVKAFVCLTDVVECGADELSSASAGMLGPSPSPAPPAAGPRPLRFRRAAPDEPPGPAGAASDPVSLIVMELADLGTLSEAVARGALHVRLPGGPVGVDLRAVLEALLDAACGLSHLHSLRIAHGGVCAANVLLKSDVSRPLGWTAKLGGFGSARILGARGEYFFAARPVGSVAHMAPETLEVGRLTTAADVYAFGILMHAVYTGSDPYPCASASAIAPAVCRGGVRPRMPCGTPDDYARLASDCWAADPAARPDMAEVIARLEALHARVAVDDAPAQGRASEARAAAAVEAR